MTALIPPGFKVRDKYDDTAEEGAREQTKNTILNNIDRNPDISSVMRIRLCRETLNFVNRYYRAKSSRRSLELLDFASSSTLPQKFQYDSDNSYEGAIIDAAYVLIGKIDDLKFNIIDEIRFARKRDTILSEDSVIVQQLISSQATKEEVLDAIESLTVIRAKAIIEAFKELIMET